MSSTGFQIQLTGYTTGITAGTTQTAAGATALTSYINNVTTVGSDNDGVILPAKQSQGTVIYIANTDAGEDISVYPNTGGTLNGGTATTGVIIVGQTQGLICTQAGTDGLTWLCAITAACTAA